MTETEPTEDSPRIQTLDESTIQRIAAGEVVERPASVVKELLENSLDAGATRIEVTVEAGGTDSIRVSDNGHGILEAELPRALEEHATSKISDIDDLEAGVGTLGFRGEALSTIGAVSRLTIRSRPQGGSTGAELTVEGGKVGSVQPAGCPEGTTVAVEELFFNTPARKKFLKRESTEFDHINTVVSQYALANPDISISLSHNGRELFGTDGGGSLRSAVLSVYGREVAESMIELEYTPDNSESIGSVSGLISHPETTRSTRGYLATFVNERYVTDATLRGAVVDGYGGQLAPDRYPFAVLFVEVPPAAVDVNVHPRKTEVRFDDSEGVLGRISDAVERTLVDNGLIRSSAPRGRSAPEETQIAPERTTGTGEKSPADNPEPPSVDAERTPKSTDDDGTSAGTPATATPVDPADEDSWTVDGLAGRSQPTESSQSATANETLSTKAASTSKRDRSRASPAGESTAKSPVESVDSGGESTHTATEPAAVDAEPRVEQSTDESRADRKDTPAEPTTQQTLVGGETTEGRSYDQLPVLRVLGQLYDTYLLAETDSGLILIDQHAADERVNYERLQQAVADSPSTQRLATPVHLELTAREAALFDDHSESLAAVGFQAERESTREIEVTAVPAVFSTTLDPELLREVLLSFVESANGGEITVTEAIDELLADLACYPSITGNTSLTEGSVVELLAALDECENPYACPHGRPVIIEISREEITDRFERDYPGHAGRREE